MSIDSRMTRNVFALAIVMLIAVPIVWSSPDEVVDSIRELTHGGKWADARKLIGDIPASDDSVWIPAQELLIRIEFLAGNIDACRSQSTALLEVQPANPTASWFLIACYLRTGEYDKALQLTEPLAESSEHAILFRTLHAQVLEARGDVDGASTVRRSLIPLLNDARNLDGMGLVAAASALRKLGEFKAANQCIQLAQDFDITDPFMKLEKIRLYRATQGYAIAEKSAFEMTKTYRSIPLAYSEWAEIKWDMRIKEEDVAALCEKALDGDPTLLDARCRLIFYALLKDNREERDALINKNLAINPNHRRTLNLQRAVQHLASAEVNTPSATDDPDFANLMADIMTARNNYGESLKWAAAFAAAQPGSPLALFKLGLATFRTGGYEDSQSLLEESLSKFPYGLQTRNLLTYLDGIVDNAAAESGILRVAYADDQDALARFVVARGVQILNEESAGFNVSLEGPLNIQLCTNLDDLAVITEGIPFGCCVDPAHPATTGVVSFDDTVFLWTPEATRSARPNYRLDEALHRGIVQAFVRAATNEKSPLWLEEGVAGYALLRESQEWAPPNLGFIIDALDRGVQLPVQDLAEGFLGSRRPFYQVYATLLIEDWTERYGESAIQALMAEIANGTTWTVALEHALGKSMERIDESSRASILTRYEALLESIEPTTKSALAMFHVGALERAATIMTAGLQRNPYAAASRPLVIDLLEGLDVGPGKSDAYFHLLEATLPVQRSDADARFQLAQWHEANDRHERALELGRSAVGIRPEWLAAHRLVADIALKYERPDVAYASLATLHEARPKHVKTLERLVICARALEMNDELIRWNEELKDIAPRSSLLSEVSANATAHSNTNIN